MARKGAAKKEQASVAVVATHSSCTDCTDYFPLLNLGERSGKYLLVEEGELAAEHGFDVVLLDCGVDADAGVQLLLRIKESRPEVPVIFVAAASSEEQAIRVFRAGARDYFRKPFSVFDLKKTVDELLRLKRGAGEKRSPLTRSREEVGGERHPAGNELPERVLRVVRYMEKNFCSEIYLESLADNACLSKYHFCRTFKSHTGLSPMQYLSLLRVQRAKLLLQHANLSVSVVALHSGFTDTSDFIRNFKKATGVTPYVYKSSQSSQ